MYRFLSIVFLICMAMQLVAQELPAPKGCGFDHYVHHLDANYPGFKKLSKLHFDRIHHEIDFRDSELYTVPVVVHIVWQTEEQNLPEDQIQEVIDVLNEDYRRLNEDAYQVRSVFEDVVGDPFIQFELVGVERVQTDATFELDLLGGALPDNVKQSSVGGSDAWDTQKHLNIWVCNIEGGSLLGYAYPPANLAHWPEGANAPSPELDGVVMHYEVFRRSGTHTSSGLLGIGGEITVPVRGRSVTHEVGHYLGLRHIWGDGLLSIIGISDCDADDGVADTPQQGLNSQFQCDPEQNSCTDGAVDLPDMFENFMDYAAEDCMNSFTQQQIAIMRSVLENERSGLLENNPVSSTDDLFEASEFLVYPNPAREQLFIQSELLTQEDFEFQLLDAQGQLVKQILSNINSGTIVISMDELPGGLYGLWIRGAEKQIMKKVLVQ